MLKSIILQELVEFCRQAKISPAALGRAALNSSYLFKRLESGAGLNLRSLETLADFMSRERARLGLVERDLFAVLAASRTGANGVGDRGR